MSSAKPIENAVLIAGPTASGKSALALEIAREADGVIINADSMQVYDVLRVLTARPDDRALEAAPHLLYGHVAPSEPYSVAAWLGDVARLAEAGEFAGRTPVFVGGTGLYFTALTLGLSDVPPVPPLVRDAWRGRLRENGPANLYRLLQERDPEMACRLKPADGQRIVRALEVLEATGRSLARWQEQRGTPLVDQSSSKRIVLDPDRDLLAERISQRFDGMVAGGALEEADSVNRLRLHPAAPALKAIGVRELIDVLEGRLTLKVATELAKSATRRYAKRQMTWFRNQFGAEWSSRPLQ